MTLARAPVKTSGKNCWKPWRSNDSDDNVNTLRLALELEDAQRAAKHLAILREYAEAGDGKAASCWVTWALTLAALPDGGADDAARIVARPKNWRQYWD
uniref:Uncharacterized protein n=1 Tax=Candidatus Kentrum sp. LFY TaxID=2126342 RepID=A0A450V794_9GAMM|nr:MAG: hypothetical protein BECKLFY1418A_GA0070994_11227 [Candidatus Kentron sp. LFY]